MLFDWDPDKSEQCRRERGFGFAYAVGIFAGNTIENPDRRFPYGEERIRAVGMVGADCVALTYTWRGEVRWIISAHPASRRDRDVYAKAFPSEDAG